MTRKSKRELDRAIEDLQSVATDDGKELQRVVIDFTPADPDPDDDTVIVIEGGPGGERCELTINEYEDAYGPLDEANRRLVADFSATNT